MGATNSKIVDDKALLLCRERRRFVRQVLDGRCTLAAAHISYIQALRNTGIALRKFIEPEHPVESSMYSSTSATPEPLALTDKSASQLSTSSQTLSQHVESVEPSPPSPSPPSSSGFHANYMKSGGIYSTVVEEKPLTSVTATVQAYLDTPEASPLPEGALHFDQPPLTPGTPPWDYFGIFHPIDRQLSFQDEKELNHGLDIADNINQFRKVEGIPDLEEDLDKSSVTGKSEYVESEDDFDQPSSETLVRHFKNRTESPNFHTLNCSTETSSVKKSDQENNENKKKSMPAADIKDIGGTPDLTSMNSALTVIPLPINGNSEAVKRPWPENKVADKESALSIKEIEKIFLRASESGKQVPRMLEANKVNFRPLVPNGKVRRSNGSTYFPACFICCQEVYNHEEPATDDVKYLTYHRSVSSLSSSSHNILGTTSRDDLGEFSHELFNSIYMNSGSHASTLDRLYAWERKLYDEVKASEIVRQEYDMKCKQLREQESRGESSEKVDQTRVKVKDSYSRVRVAIERISSISRIIEKIRDEELQPQLEELIEGLSQMWSTMLNCHKDQCSIISMARNNWGVKISMQLESHRQAAVVLESALNFLCSSFKKWISAHINYLCAIKEWLLKCVSLDSIQHMPSRQKSSKKRNPESFCPWKFGAPPIYVTCQEWLTGLDGLPTEAVEDAIKDLVEEIGHFMPRQEQNHGSASISRSLSQKFGRSSELIEMLRTKDPADWNLNLDNFWSCLESFLDRLKTFSEESVKMYGGLRDSINKARDHYENPGRRMQPATGNV